MSTPDSTPEGKEESATDAQFRAEARAWLEANARRRSGDDQDWSRFHFSGDPSPEADAEHVRACQEWQRKLYDGGWAGIAWPEEFGGRGAHAGPGARSSPASRDSSRSTPACSRSASGWSGRRSWPTARPAQQERYLRPMLRGDEVWCQLFSEPGAGSDLAGLRTRAERDGDEWVVNGQKVWSSGAHHSDLGILLTRTEPRCCPSTAASHTSSSTCARPASRCGRCGRSTASPTSTRCSSPTCASRTRTWWGRWTAVGRSRTRPLRTSAA